MDIPYVKDSDTSLAAARKVKSRAANMRQQILALILAAGDDGLTCDEVEVLLDMKHQTASARITELKAAGLIKDSLRRRDTRSETPAVVYVVVIGQ